MLTVKYVSPDGDETVFPVLTVCFTPRKIGESLVTPNADVAPNAGVTFDRPKDSGPGLMQVSSGCVYVMNENGKTVSKYDLGPYGVSKYDLGPYGDVPWVAAATGPARASVSAANSIS